LIFLFAGHPAMGQGYYAEEAWLTYKGLFYFS